MTSILPPRHEFDRVLSLAAPPRRGRYRCWMELLHRIADLSTGQWGLVTAVQARAAGISGQALARATERGELIRVHHGVYELAGSEEWSSFGDWAAQWLALRPGEPVERRRKHPDCVVSHAAAAQLQNLGVITADKLELTAPQRINVSSKAVRTYRGAIGEKERDWHVVEGLPVTTPSRTVRDLLRLGGDGAHIGSVVSECLTLGYIHHDSAIAFCEAAVHQWGRRPGDGEDLLHQLLSADSAPPDSAG